MAADDAAGSPWAELLVGVAVVHQQAIDRLAVPALILELPTRRITAANRAVAELFGTTPAALIGLRNDEAVRFDDVEGMVHAVSALNEGAIDGYRARRRITGRDGVRHDVLIWSRLVQLDTTRYAAYIVTRPDWHGRAAHADAPLAWAGPLVVGTADAGWRIERVSSDLNDVFGVDAAEAVGTLLLDVIHPDDVGGLLRAARDSLGEGIVSMRHLRARHRDGTWVPVQCLLLPFGDRRPAGMAFALLPEPEPTAGPATEQVAELERRLRRVATELRAAGFMDGVDTLPSNEAFPQLASLTSRQWQIVVRLLRGERVPGIARELHVTQGSLRNQLSAMFELFGVHSQAELIALLRGGTAWERS